MSQPNIAYLNFFVDGSLPTVFNPNTFKTTSIQTDQMATQTLVVSSQTNTNGIVDYNTIEAQKLNVNNEALFTGSLVPNSTCIATTFYVDDKINQLIGGSGVNTLLDSIAEINQALNNDPNYAQTIGLRLGQNETNIQTNANNIIQVNNNINTINNTLLQHDSKLTLDRTDINDIVLTLSSLQTDVSTNAGDIDIINSNLTTLNPDVNTLKSQMITANSNITTINNTLPTKANVANPSFTGTATFNTITTQSLTDNGNITIKGNTTIGDNVNDTMTVSGTAKFNNNLLLSDNSNALTRLNNNDTSISTINSNISTINSTLTTKANDNQVIHITGNEILSGVKTFNDVPKIGLNSIATVADVNTAINNLVSGAGTAYDTLMEIQTILEGNAGDINTILSTMVNVSGTQTITGAKSFSVAPSIPTLAQNNNSNSCASTSYVDTGLATKANTANPTFTGTANFTNISTQALTDNGNISIKGNTTIGDQSTDALTVNGTATFNHNVMIGGQNVGTRLSNIESNYLTTANASSTYQPIASMSNYLTTSNASSTYQPISEMSNYLTTANASSTYQPISSMSSYVQTSLYSNNNSWSGTNEYSTDLITNKMVEKYVAGTVSSNAFSINYSSNTNNIYSIAPSSANNIALTITNIPTNRGTAIYNFTFLINTSTNKNYINSVNINGSPRTLTAMGGVSNISINSSSTIAIQNLYVVMNGATVSNVITSVSSCF